MGVVRFSVASDEEKVDVCMALEVFLLRKRVVDRVVLLVCVVQSFEVTSGRATSFHWPASEVHVGLISKAFQILPSMSVNHSSALDRLDFPFNCHLYCRKLPCFEFVYGFKALGPIM